MATKKAGGGGRLTAQQITETIGAFKPTHPRAKAKAQVQAEDTDAQQIRQLVADALVIAAKYNEAAKGHEDDARTAVDPNEVAGDRAALEQMFADEYTFTDPFGVVGDKRSTVDRILSGAVRKDGFGKNKGFETVTDNLQVSGTTAVSTGTFKMKGQIRARFVESGAVRRKDVSGEYRTTHTYVKRGGRWMLIASQMTEEPKAKSFEQI